MANERPVWPASDDRGPKLLGVIVPLFAFALLVYLARIWTRIRPKVALTPADYTITLAMISYTLNLTFLSIAITHGFGKHTSDIPRGIPGIITVSNHILGCWITGALSSSFARISIACLLLSITPSRRWRILLWSTIALQALFMLSYVVVQLVQCKGTVSSQSRAGGSDAQCLGRTQVLAFSYVSVSVCMISDLICSVVPLFIVWRLSRSTLEKMLVLMLMTSCLLATACGVPKIYFLVVFDFDSRDALWELIPEFFWCQVEVGIIIVAACAPLLKAPIERCMRRAGLPTFGVPMRDLNRVSSVALGSKVGWEEGGGRRWMGSGSETEGGVSLGTTVGGGDEESGGVDRRYEADDTDDDGIGDCVVDCGGYFDNRTDRGKGRS
ncbi:hypothetical protein QBC34DRAFT_484163 [Podospora aff. communis PSN243]|uniref:Rhodopsin domain-containing protein n=1 Tax=Podospora aff. communis PSN243 TaxID=3040156 RepID=A0AAV9GSF5_9PEZI|nr:hypothetical protein QBC34DRAFT_484163 [Podospora aff. communis PSN243]